ncbi:hypothetical protein [Actinokineospora fastidiosa]|uniref:Uncharacterized protein n=1 Tax=Actinokineospora fastidiosa TaxID=1816 RepID=A0A918GKC7_9PSEU|nr:hypothetical protein [Actinokineospora fastidiosa]GGS44058.1 hypothetical protein GCM10010171_44040 [Actinokineospora fastidiosa]
MISGVVSLTFLFGFGNVLNLALRLGVPLCSRRWSLLRLIFRFLGFRSARGTWRSTASPDVLRPARRLLIFARAVTLALNVADPIGAGELGTAAFDAVGPSSPDRLG